MLGLELPRDKEEALDELLAQCRFRLKPFCEIFLPQRFTRPFSRQHDAFFEVYDDESVQKLLVVAHRGWGKTSIFNYAVPLQAITFAKSRFIVPVSATSLVAGMQSENLKRALLQNPDLKGIVGDIEGDTFAKEMWKTANGVMVLPRGAGQQVRGVLSEDSRPDLILVDDLEKTEGVASEEQRRQMKEYFFGDLYNTVDRAEKDWRVVVVGTVLHQSSLLTDLMKDPSWTVINQPLCSKTLVSFWPERFTNEAVAEIHDDLAKHGMLSTFYREFLNEPASPDDLAFDKKFFRYYSESEVDFRQDEFEHFVIMDPARSTKPSSCPTAIIGGSINTRLGKIYFRELYLERAEPDQAVTACFDMAVRLGSRLIGYEIDGLELYQTQLMQSEMNRRGLSFELVELRSKSGKGDYQFKGAEKGKDSRISQLIPWYRMLQVVHNDNGALRPLEEQLESFPFGDFVDAADAASYVIQLMSLGERVFEDQSTPMGAYAAAEEERLLEQMLREDSSDKLLPRGQETQADDFEGFYDFDDSEMSDAELEMVYND